MKKEFTLSEIIRLSGCYSEEQVRDLLSEDKDYTLAELMALNIPTKDKIYFLYISIL